jgi:hypothetical protein
MARANPQEGRLSQEGYMHYMNFAVLIDCAVHLVHKSDDDEITNFQASLSTGTEESKRVSLRPGP